MRQEKTSDKHTRLAQAQEMCAKRKQVTYTQGWRKHKIYAQSENKWQTHKVGASTRDMRQAKTSGKHTRLAQAQEICAKRKQVTNTQG